MNRFGSLRLYLAFCGVFCASSSGLRAQQYAFPPVAGSPKGVTNLFQDSRGRLWLGGADLACFDGARFFFLRDYGFPTAETYDVTEDSSGAIWIGAQTGVYRFADGRVEELAKGVAVSVIAATPDVAIAAVGPLGKGIPITTSNLIRISRTKAGWKVETMMDLASPGPLTLDHTGWLLYPWLESGWYELRLEEVIRWRPGQKLAPKSHSVWTLPAAGGVRILRDRAGCVWIGRSRQNIYDCGDGVWREAPFEGAGAGRNPRESPDGSMLLLDYNMLARGRPKDFRLARLANGLPVLSAAIQARDGTIWLGGPEGISRFPSPFRLEYWASREGVVAAWCVARVGAKVYAGFDRSVAVLRQDRQRWQQLASFGTEGQVVNLLPADDGTLLVALNPSGVAAMRPDGKVAAHSNPRDKGFYGLRLARAFGREIWMSGLSIGTLRREGSQLIFKNHALNTRPYGNVLDLQYEEHARKLWACYTGGLAERSEDGSWREFTKKDGLLVDACWSLAALPNGDIWYGYYTTPAFALILPNGNGGYTVRQFREADEIPDPESITFDADQRGWLWRGGNHVVSVADPGEAESGRWLQLDETDGLPAAGMNSGSYFADPDGSLWWGADNNVVHYMPPPDFVQPAFAPQAFVSAFSWNGSPPRLAEAVSKISHGSKITAHIGSLQFDRRNALRIRYRLLPGQTAWHESKSLDLQLGSLSAGTHTIEVQARVFTGPWSGTVRQSFTVLRPAALAWPFLAAYFIGAGGLAAGGYVLHKRRVAEHAVLLPNLTAWRMGALMPEVHALAGTLLDARFEVGGLLARGGFANVFSGYDREQEQRCAVKIFSR